jgi:hypothetical protein
MELFVAAMLGAVVGGLVGAFATRRWLRGRQAAPKPVAAAHPAEPEAPAVSAEPASEEDLKPVLEATRGVVSELEQRYQGARAAGDGEARKPRQPRRRA